MNSISLCPIFFAAILTLKTPVDTVSSSFQILFIFSKNNGGKSKGFYGVCRYIIFDMFHYYLTY